MNELRRFLGLVFGVVAVTCAVSPVSSFIRTMPLSNYPPQALTNSTDTVALC